MSLFLTMFLATTTPHVGDVSGATIPTGSESISMPSASTLWLFATEGSVTSSPALGDVNGDGLPDVVIGSLDSNNIHA